jgi:hypothetical protein
MPRNRSQNGGEKAGFTQTIRAAGFNGIAVTTAAAGTKMICGRLRAGAPFTKYLITKISQAATDAKQRPGFPSRNAGSRKAV